MNLAFQDENSNQRDIPQSFPQIEEYILQLFDAAELQGKTFTQILRPEKLLIDFFKLKIYFRKKFNWSLHTITSNGDGKTAGS